MSDVNNEVKQGADSLAPIKDKDRIMGWGSYLMLWLGGCISIGTLTMGSAQLDKGLNRCLPSVISQGLRTRFS